MTFLIESQALSSIGEPRCSVNAAEETMIKDPKPISSPLSRKVTADGITIDVEIYRFENENFWRLELVDEGWNATVYEDKFTTDQAAWDAFQQDLASEGLIALLRTNGVPMTIH